MVRAANRADRQAGTKGSPSFGLAISCAIAFATIVNAVSFFGSTLWVAPDTSYYVELAGGLAERLDFATPLFLIRPAGYPLMLAAILILFGTASSTAILVVQHAMVAATAAIVALIAWNLTRSRAAAVVAGLMCACSLQLIAFANVIMTEAPYTFVLVGSVYYLVRYHLHGRSRSLAAASLLAGVSYLFRPIGMSVVGVCLLAAFHRTMFSPAGSRCHTVTPVARLRRYLSPLVCALAPALAVTVPGMIQNKLVHGGELSGRCADLALYYRVACIDKLDSAQSAALNEIKGVVNDAVNHGHLPPGADYRQWGVVWKAYESAKGVGLAESSAIMGQASKDLIREHPGRFAALSAKYCYWMLMVPDSFYRFHPGGAPGVRTVEGERIRDAEAEIFDTSTYEPMMRRWTGPYERYLHLQEPVHAGRVAAFWSGLNRWFYRIVETGPHVGPFDSIYEAFTWACLLCAAGTLAARNRSTWFLVIAVIALQIGVSAVLAGPTPRYAVPIKPLLLLFPAMMIGTLARATANVRQGSLRTHKWRAKILFARGGTSAQGVNPA